MMYSVVDLFLVRADTQDSGDTTPTAVITINLLQATPVSVAKFFLAVNANVSLRHPHGTHQSLQIGPDGFGGITRHGDDFGLGHGLILPISASNPARASHRVFCIVISMPV